MVKQERWRLVVSLLLGAAVGGLLFSPLPFSSYRPLTKALLDVGHIPLFVVLTAAISLLLPERRNKLRDILAVVILIVLFTEFAQQLTGRSLSLRDMINDLYGAIIALLGLWAWKNRRDAFCPSLFVIAATMLLTVSLQRSLYEFRVEQWRKLRMPILSDFEDERDMQLWSPLMFGNDNSASMERLHDEFNGSHLLKVVTSKARWAGVEYDAGLMSWADYDFLLISFLNPGKQVRLTVRIDDDGDTQDYTSRFNQTFEIVPGASIVVIPIEDIKHGPKTRELNLRKIKRLLLFSPEHSSQTFLIDRVSLESVTIFDKRIGGSAGTH